MMMNSFLVVPIRCLPIARLVIFALRLRSQPHRVLSESPPSRCYTNTDLDAFLDVHRLQRILVPAVRDLCQIPDLHTPLFPRAGQESRRSIPSTPWVETLRPLPIALPPRSPNNTPPGPTQPHHPLRSLHSDPVPPWPSDPSLVGLPPCPLPDSSVSLVEICGGIATGLEALLRGARDKIVRLG